MIATAWALDRHTAVAGDAGGPALATIGDGLSGFGGAAHGGLVAAIALRAMAAWLDAAERPPRSLTIHLLDRALPGPLAVDARIERAGATMTAAAARLEQAGRPVALALGAFGRARPSLRRVELVMPRVPGPGACAPLVRAPVPEASAVLQVEHRPAAPPLPLTGADRAELVVWMRLVDDRPVDALAACFLADAAAPALYAALERGVPMPTVELAVHLAEGADGTATWVLAVLRHRTCADGYALEDGELWTADGRLVALSRQLRRVAAGT
jgi:acyl-CoA thioesterase